MNTLDALLKDIDNLKPVPAIVNQIMAVAEKPDSSMGEIADIILYDPAMTANILKISNSAFYGIPEKINSVHDAVAMIGMDQVIYMVLMKSGSENMVNSQEGYGLNEGELWRHAVSSALIAKHLAEKKSSGHKHMVFTAALLKDIGKIILDRYVSDKSEQIDSLVSGEGLSFRAAEKKVFGIDHAELGGIITKMWSFSPKMVAMIRNHHLDDESAKNDLDTQILYVADNICMMMGIGVGVDGLAYRFHKDVMKNLDISPEDLQTIIASFSDEMKKVEDLINTI